MGGQPGTIESVQTDHLFDRSPITSRPGPVLPGSGSHQHYRNIIWRKTKQFRYLIRIEPDHRASTVSPAFGSVRQRHRGERRGSNRPPAALFSWTKSGRSPRSCRASCSGFFRKAPTNASVMRKPGRWTRASHRRRQSRPQTEVNPGTAVTLKRGTGQNLVTDGQMQRWERENTLLALQLSGGKIHGPEGAVKLLQMKPTPLASRIRKIGLKKSRP